MKQPCVYILSNQARGTLYIGVTSNLIQRVWQHKQNLVDGFSKKHQLHLLVYYEQFEDMLIAINREKQLKKWNRAWKIELVESINSDWRDLYLELTQNYLHPHQNRFPLSRE
jgi:putative endonuclease